MPTVTLNKTVFEKLVGKKLPLEELKDRISMLGTDLESVQSEEITVEIFPNRPDMLSEQGFARAFSSFIGVKKGLRTYPVKKSDAKIIVDRSVLKYRPCSAAAIVKGVKFTHELIKEIMQNQEKMHVTYGRNRKKVALGYYILDKIKFPIYYRADDPRKIKFKPLHFDRVIDGLQILSQHPTGREFGYQLEGLDQFPVYYDSNNAVLSMPPIINSDDSGNVVPGTCDILIECSGFDQSVLNLAINMAATVLADMGGEIYSVEIVYPDKKVVSPNLSPEKMKLDLSYVNKRLGLELKENEVQELLERMGFGYDQGTVLIPAYRADVLHQVDLVEDIAIAYGYENFQEEIPNVSTIGEENPLEKFSRKVREAMLGLRLMEVKNYHLLTEPELNQKMCLSQKIITLKNALGDYNCLRNSLFPSLLKNLHENLHHEYPQNLFELGRVFQFADTETGVGERKHFAVALAHEKTDFTEIRQVLDALFSSLGQAYEVKESAHPSFIPGRVGEIFAGKKKLGVIGELHPLVLENWGLSVPVVGMELDLEGLFGIVA